MFKLYMNTYLEKIEIIKIRFGGPKFIVIKYNGNILELLKFLILTKYEVQPSQNLMSQQ